MGQSRLSELVFVKLGGSVITDKTRPFTARPEVIYQLAGELRAALAACPELRVLLGHGSGSFGHIPARKYHVRQGIAPDGEWWGFVETSAVAARLNRIVTDVFLESGVSIWSVQPSASAHCRGGQLVSLTTGPIREAWKRGLVPLVHGDVVFDEQQGCTIVSTEELFSFLAHEMPVQRMVLVGEVDGVFDRDPLVDPAAVHIPRITPASFARLSAQLGGSHAADVTGGMLTKVQTMVSLVSSGQVRRVHLVSGRRAGALADVLLDEDTCQGTVIEQAGEEQERN
jgi:isopentenyl phosphate kinase